MIDNILILFAEAFTQPYLTFLGVLVGFIAIIVALEIYRKKSSPKIEAKKSELLAILHDSRDKQIKFYSEFMYRTFMYQKDDPKQIYSNIARELKTNSYKTWEYYKHVHKKKYNNYSSIENDAREINQHIRIAEDLILQHDRSTSSLKRK